MRKSFDHEVKRTVSHLCGFPRPTHNPRPFIRNHQETQMTDIHPNHHSVLFKTAEVIRNKGRPRQESQHEAEAISAQFQTLR